MSVNKTIWYSNIFSVGMFIFLGLFGALAYPAIDSGNILEVTAVIVWVCLTVCLSLEFCPSFHPDPMASP